MGNEPDPGPVPEVVAALLMSEEAIDAGDIRYSGGLISRPICFPLARGG